MDGIVEEAEQAGHAFAFKARSLAAVAVGSWLLFTVDWPRNLYYAGLAATLLTLGFVPYLLRRHPAAEAIRLVFIVLDAALITVAIILPPPGGIAVDWPIQTRLRGYAFLYLLLLLGEATLTYSPRRVLWTGGAIIVVWSIGYKAVFDLPDTLRCAEELGPGAKTAADLLGVYLNPRYVSLPSWTTEIVATALLTLLLALAVMRSRIHLLAEVKSEVVRADLARYVSPDIAGAVADRAASGFGEPATRNVAVLFADIVGFTGLTEHLSPERTFALLESFQERSAKVVLRHRGTLDKYLGDGLMVTFGALEDEHDAPERAIACAFALRQEIEHWNIRRKGRNAAPISISVGVHYGPVIVGNLGSRQRTEFTVVGDVVNVASRLEAATRQLDGSIAVSADCVHAAGPHHAEAFSWTVDLSLRGRQASLRAHVA